ncbi:hypothetical protein AJ79_06942 [Helicocarpus griseus UAMH5409]|uniref:xylan 1,4-beta-xylosidase n=1 Tax=Helicocarpus griseus UAMH5409 TaxID=1447875 RepID=A0A2B7X7P1_9EURO|nr:hypothetical protein AJ79_06942 [Helicocarpus griseus UAMH5409]
MQRYVTVATCLASLVAAQTYTFPDCVNGPLASNKVCDRLATPSERAAALVAALEPTEKLQNIIRSAKGAPRIGLPAYNWWNEALHGVAYSPNVTFADEPPFDSATSFPMPLLMAATFDDELIERVGDIVGKEARAWGNYGYSGIDFWTPNVNPFRDPRWGRGSETPGEDALQVSRYAAAMVRGLEGYKSERRIVATCKHYAGNDFEDWGGSTRHDFDAKITLQDLAEYHLLPFQQCARDSKVGSIMCAYNAVNGVPSCANEYLLQTVLREHWNWTENNNHVTSDCEAVYDVWGNHHYASSNAEGTAMCFNAGTDNSCEYQVSSDIPGAWEQGLLTEDVVDRSLLRSFEALVHAGYFDGAHSAYATLNASDVNTPEAQDLALQTAVDGIVLLKNDEDTLPLDLSPGANIAMIGFWASDSSKVIGGYSGNPPFTRSPAYAAEDMGFTVHSATGPVLESNDAPDNWTADALAAAEKSDYILYFGGLDTSAAGEEKDRYSLEWPEAQRTLLGALSGLSKPLVVVQLGDQLDDTELLEMKEINSIMWASWPGQDGGTAVMKLITGAASPAGRLPVTQYPASYADAIPLTDMNLRPSGSYPGRTYRWYLTPVQGYGFGLHYTTFKPSFGSSPASLSIQELVAECEMPYPDTCPLPPLHVKVANEGKRISDYVALAFIAGEFGPEPYPIKTLGAYARLRGIEPGTDAEAELAWKLGDLARRDEDGNTVLYPGTYTVMLDEPVKATMEFELTGEPAILDKWPAPN